MKLSKFKLGLIVLIAIVVVFIIVAITPVGLNNDEIETLNSIQSHDNGTFFTMNAYYNNSRDYFKGNDDISYAFNNYLNTKGSLGIINMDSFGCSAFYKKYNGHWITGRNFDLVNVSSTPVIINSTPKHGYRSIAISDTYLIHKGLMGLANKPYLTLIRTSFDGINEEGVSISVLELENESTDSKDTDKGDLTHSDPVRLVLDNANSTDNAVKILKNYDYLNELMNYHFFITDKNGDSVAVEYYDGEMYVTDTNILTNHKLNFTDSDNLDYDSLIRFKIINKSLASDKPMDILEKVSGKYTGDNLEIINLINKDSFDVSDVYTFGKSDRTTGWLTYWSVVYDNTNCSMDVCFNQNYDKVYHFSL